MDNNCIFCKIAAGEIPSSTVYEDGEFRVIMDMSPAAKGHCIILPKEHAANIFELSEETAGKIFAVAKKVATAMKEELGCEGINVLQNNGEAAGQTVFHVHMHLIHVIKEMESKCTGLLKRHTTLQLLQAQLQQKFSLTKK